MMNQNDDKKWQKFREACEEMDSTPPDDGADNDLEENETEAELEEAQKSSSTSKPEASLEHLSYEQLEEKLTLAEQKNHEYWEKLTRMTAEVDNARRRGQREVEQAYRYGTEKLINSLLPVLDSLEQAISLVDKEEQTSMHEGLALTLKLFLDTLEKQEVKVIDPVGQPFNPQEHEAMAMVESDEYPANTVMNVFQKGYRLYDRVIRAAKVIVSKTKAS